MSFEERQARADHRNIAEAIAACSGIGSLEGQAPSVLEALRVPSRTTRKKLATAEKYTVALGSSNSAGFALSNYARAAIYLSDSITRLRVEAAYSAVSNDKKMDAFQWAIVIFGAVTTILISFKSIMSNEEALKEWSRRIGFAAIICSAVGTATAALNSFYSPREAYLKAERSLAALRQLQSDMAVQIASTAVPPDRQDSPDKTRCPLFAPDDKSGPLAKQVQDWKNKLDLIVNALDSTSAATSETSQSENDDDASD